MSAATDDRPPRALRLSDISFPASPAARAAYEVAAQYQSAAMLNHCLRTYIWAVGYANRKSITFDAELLYVSAMLHDIALTTTFDTHRTPFEEAGAEIARVLTTGAGWTPERRNRVANVIIRHMWDEVDPTLDREGHLLEVSTGIDISGRQIDQLPEAFRNEVLDKYARHDLAQEFLKCVRDQAQRKPHSRAASFVARGFDQRVANNPLDVGTRHNTDGTRSATQERAPSNDHEIVIRSGTSHDVTAIVSLWELSGGPSRFPGNERTTRNLLDRDPEALLVATAGHTIIGTLILGWDGWRCHLYRLAIDDTWRRRGIARLLLDEATRRAARGGAWQLDAMVNNFNEEARSFWSSCQFEPDPVETRWFQILRDPTTE